MSGAEKQSRYRERLRCGRVCLTIEVDEADVLEALLCSQRLSEEEALDHELVERAAADVLREWVKRWLAA